MSEDILDNFNADSADEVSDIRYDATMSNLLTKMGTGSDRTTQTVPHGIGYWSQQTLEDLAEHLILNRVASAKVDASTQKGWELTLGSDGDDDILEDFNDLHDDLEIEEAFNEAQFQANVYGGAVIIIIVDDKKPAYEPIDTKNLKKVVKLEVLDRYKVEPVLALTDVNPLRPDKYRLILPEYVRKSLKTVVDDNPQYIIDKSRIIRFDADGIRATPDMLRKNQGWTKSLLAALWEDYLEWKTSLKATGAMVQDASIFIYKLQNLSAMMKSKDSLLLEGRIKLFRSMLSVIGGAIIDAEKESMEFISRNFAGVPEVANQQRDNFIGVADIPHTKLFGESPSGLGASGESEQKDWASTIADFQTSKWRKKLRGLFKLIFLSKEGPTNGELIKGWSIKFHNLMVESEAEKISNMATMASTDQTYISAGVLLVEEVRKSRFGKSGFSIETTLDDKLFKKQQDEAKQQAQDPYGGYGGFPEEQAPPEELPPEGEVPPEEVQQDSYDYRADAVDISSLKQKDGKVFYLGKWWQPDNPMPSDRPGKKRMVLAKEGDQVALVHYGAEGYKHNYSPEAKKSFLARMQGVRTKDGKPAYKDKFSPAYWAIKDLWNPNEPADGSAKYDAMSVGGFADELNASSYSRPKKILNWNNIGIGLTHEAGDVRFPMSEPMKCGYGHIRGSYGDAPDKKALDVYVGDDLKSSNGYKVRQLDPKTGFYDEDKYFIGFKTPEDVRNNFIYHAGASRFGGIEPIKPDELSAYRQDNCGCSVPEIDAGTKVLSGDRRITVTNDKNIADAITSIYPEKISSLDKWDVAGNGNIFGEFSSDYGTYKFGIKKGSKQDVLTYKWNRESKTDSVIPKKKDEDVVDLIVEKYRRAIAQGINSWINVIAKKIQSEDNLENINVADYYDSLTSKQFMNQLEQSILISKLAGMLDTENDEVDFKADGIADWFKQTFAEQLAYFRSKLIFTTKSWKDFRAEQYDVAFTISGLTRGDLLEDAKWLVDKAIANGDDVETFKRQFKRLIGRKGWQADDNRIYTILDTNSRRSYAAGRWQQAMTPEIMQRRPYLVWVHRDSVVPRPNHLALNNKAIRSDHPFWKVAFPSCFPGNTLVATPDGWRRIDEVKENDLVIGGSGDIKPVNAVYKRSYAGNMIRIATESFRELLSTPNHRILTLRGWVRAENLKITDVIVQVREASSLDNTVSNINQVDTLTGNDLMSLPVQRVSAEINTFNTKPQRRDVNINPSRKFVRGIHNAKIMSCRQSNTMEMFNNNKFVSGWSSLSVRTSFRAIYHRLMTILNGFVSNFFTKKRTIDLQLFADSSSRFRNFLCLSESRMVSSFLSLCNLPHLLATSNSSFGISDILNPDFFMSISSRDFVKPHQLHDCSCIDDPKNRQVFDSKILIEVPESEGFVYGYPLNFFDSLDDFRIWAIANADLHKVTELDCCCYDNTVYNLSVARDESYCTELGVVHNCAFGCRCTAFTANERMLNRMGATILDNPPDPMTVAETGFQRAAGSMPEVERQEIIDSTLARLSPEIREKVEANVSDQSREDAWWNPMQHIRNSRGQFAKKAVGRTIKVGTRIVASNLPTAAKKAAKVGANVTAKKIAGENANLKEEATNLIAEISGEGLGNVLGGITGGKPGELIGGLLGSIASDGIKHVTKISKKEYAEAALDQAFQAASAIAKTKMLAENIANEIKRTSKEHQETVKDTVSGWIAENIAGTLNNDIVTTLASEFINPTDIKEIIRKIRERRANNPGASNQNNSNNSP